MNVELWIVFSVLAVLLVLVVKLSWRGIMKREQQEADYYARHKGANDERE